MSLEFANNGGAQAVASVAAFTPPNRDAGGASISFWTRLTSLAPALQRFFGSSTDFEVRISSAGIVTQDLYTNTDGPALVTALVVGTWYHIVATGIRTGGVTTTLQIFLNGVLEATLVNPPGPTQPGAATFTLGNRTGIASAQGLRGLLDDVRVYSRVLSAAEVATIYAARGADGIEDGLILRTQLKEAAPTVSPVGAGFTKDISPNKNDYSPTGAPVYSDSVVRSRRRVA